MFNTCAQRLLYGTQSTDSNQSTQTTQEISDIIIETNNDQETSNSRQIVRVRVENKAAERSRLYRERHREEINQRRRDIRQRKRKVPATAAERNRNYRERNRNKINERRRDSRLRQQNQYPSVVNVKQESAIDDNNVDATLSRGVKQEFIEIELTPVDVQKYVQATSTPDDASSVNVGQDACIKVDPEDAHLDIGPIEFQHMDSCYRTNQKLSVVKTENTIGCDGNYSVLGRTVKEESVDNKCVEHNRQSTCTNSGVESSKITHPPVCEVNAAISASTQQQDVVVIKEEPSDESLELGPAAFQHMDCDYRTYKEAPFD